jgi:CRISPR system Cascade subunit CasE
MYLSRISLSKNPSAKALDALLNPTDQSVRMDAHHRLMWMLFADHADRRRDFLWREESKGEFTILSAREPKATDLFSNLQVKPFAPDLTLGDKLHFKLRLNATRRKGKSAGEYAGNRVDIVMDVLHKIPKEERAEKRMDIAQAECEKWLQTHSERHGFTLKSCHVDDYSVFALPPKKPKHKTSRKKQPQFGILDVQGQLEIRDNEAFNTMLFHGLGRAKAYGCGLMLIRRSYE